MDPVQRIICDWCGGQSRPNSKSCTSCAAQLDVKNLLSDSGWREAPRLRDMSEIRCGNSVCQLEGEIVPVAEITLGHGGAVFFAHHVMLWTDNSVPLTTLAILGGFRRVLDW